MAVTEINGNKYGVKDYRHICYTNDSGDVGQARELSNKMTEAISNGVLDIALDLTAVIRLTIADISAISSARKVAITKNKVLHLIYRPKTNVETQLESLLKKEKENTSLNPGHSSFFKEVEERTKRPYYQEYQKVIEERKIAKPLLGDGIPYFDQTDKRFADAKTYLQERGFLK